VGSGHQLGEVVRGEEGRRRRVPQLGRPLAPSRVSGVQSRSSTTGIAVEEVISADAVTDFAAVAAFRVPDRTGRPTGPSR
jgi:hypothetical protein